VANKTNWPDEPQANIPAVALPPLSRRAPRAGFSYKERKNRNERSIAVALYDPDPGLRPG
jgi:hypothetical protein